MRKVAITGVDGTGKSTLLQGLETKLSAATGLRVACQRYPELFATPGLPWATSARALAQILAWADTHERADIKSLALFMSMSLYGRIEAWWADGGPTGAAPDLLLTERQCLVDSLVYGRVYRRFLAQIAPAPEQASSLSPTMATIIGRAQAEHLIEDCRGWLPDDSPLGPFATFEELMAAILALFDRPFQHQWAALSRLYHGHPGAVLLLTVAEQTLARRLAARAANVNRHELHEQVPLLLHLQSTYKDTLEALASVAVVTRWRALAPDSQSIDVAQTQLLSTLAVLHKEIPDEHCPSTARQAVDLAL